MNEETGVHYLTPWKINETIEGLGGIGEVIEIMGILSMYIYNISFFRTHGSYFFFHFAGFITEPGLIQ